MNPVIQSIPTYSRLSWFIIQRSLKQPIITPRIRGFHSRGLRSSFVRDIMTSTSTEGKVIKFGPFEVTKQVFVTTTHSYGLVNLKPLLPGHILICPLKQHVRLTDLSPAETVDLFSTVQLAQRLLARIYFPSKDLKEGGFTVALQDGIEAGQTVPHVHVHIIPRRKGDMGESSPDQVYVDMSSEKGNVGGGQWDLERRPKPSGNMPRIEDASREARTMEDMEKEAEEYKAVLREMGVE